MNSPMASAGSAPADQGTRSSRRRSGGLISSACVYASLLFAAGLPGSSSESSPISGSNTFSRMLGKWQPTCSNQVVNLQFLGILLFLPTAGLRSNHLRKGTRLAGRCCW